MWHIYEHRRISRSISKLPIQVIKKYELWKDLVFRHGPEKLKEFPGFHDEKLRGERQNQRSSRLNDQFRVIYEIEKETISVNVIELTPHKY